MMTLRAKILLLLACSVMFVTTAPVVYPAPVEMKCDGGIVPVQDSGSRCADPYGTLFPPLSEGSLSLLLPLQSGPSDLSAKIIPLTPDRIPGQPVKIILYFFWGKGCPHCEEEKKFLARLQRDQPSLEVKEFEVWYHRENAGLMAAMLQAHGVGPSGVPLTFVHDRVFSGFSVQTGTLIEKTIAACSTVICADPGGVIRKKESPGQTGKTGAFAAASTVSSEKNEATGVTIPYLGALDSRKYSLPVLTVVIAGMDSFNPCAFFVLLSLLSLLVHAGSRGKMLLIGGIFVFFSAFIYFLFMAAWLNLFLLMGHVAVITTAAGWVSVVIAGINIKDFFLFKRGLSLSIPDSAKPRLFERMRMLLRSTSLVPIIIGASVLALLANFYELLCTAGFPMVFTRILTLSNLSAVTYYLYLLLYNTVYVIPLFVIVLGFTLTLGKRQLSEWHGRVLKLISGTMMLGLGGFLLVAPELLNSVAVSVMILASALGISLLVASATRRKLEVR